MQYVVALRVLGLVIKAENDWRDRQPQVTVHRHLPPVIDNFYASVNNKWQRLYVFWLSVRPLTTISCAAISLFSERI